MNHHYTKTVFNSVAFEKTATTPAGTDMNLPLGTVQVRLYPAGTVTVQLESADPKLPLTANAWNGPYYFEADGLTQHTISLFGSSVTTTVLCDIDTELNADLTEPE